MSYRLDLPLPKGCGKKCHYSRAIADEHRAALERWDQANGSTKAGTLKTYWCEQCRAYHVGHHRAIKEQP
jgi:hypothetical protein